ncbi:MAG TPA: alpha/beta hydrolase family protein [Actinomycetota bacterium]|nr:alpha/beta hydrolase family protein [Actinomycetota bacterium]
MKLANSRPALFATLFVTRFFGRYSARLAGVPASVLWFTPWRVPVSERGSQKQARWLEPTQPFVLKTGSGRLSGFTAGEGPLVVLVHGWGERAASLGGFIAPLTQAGFRVLGFDLPAHGASTGQMSNPLDAAEALREVADRSGGAHAVIAHSLGATAALSAMREGLAVKRAILLAPNVHVTSALGTFQTMFGLPDAAMVGLKRTIERRFGSDIWRYIDGDSLAKDLEIPGVVFHDPGDPLVPFAGSEKLVRAWAGSKLIPAAGLGHGAITRDPAVIEAAVAFVTSEVEWASG